MNINTMQHDHEVINYIINYFDGMLNKTSIMKLLYLCELDYVVTNHERLTSFDIKHYNHGVYAQRVHNLLDEHFCITESKTFISDKGLLEESSTQLNPEQKKHIDSTLKKYEFIKKYGSVKGQVLEDLVSNTYRTKPFLETEFNQVINFDKYLDDPTINKVLIQAKTYKKLRDPKCRPVDAKLNAIYQQFLIDLESKLNE